MDIVQIEDLLRQGEVGTVVVTMGNTGLGAVDDLSEILELQKKYDFRIHADAAYGGYFMLADGLNDDTRQSYDDISKVDSIVIDPHKHGLQPYGCGCILFKDATVGSLYKHDSPFTYFSSAELHLGEISLECSRPGASAVALWATQRLLPLERGGAFAADLALSLKAARDFHAGLEASEFFTPVMPPELDIVVYAVNAKTMSKASESARQLFEKAATRDLHLALVDFPASLAKDWLPDLVVDSDTITCLRSVLMKPEHEAWTKKIVTLLERCLP
jgi:glutamate/tyrosine decarboxylase-like PLP-dependent enzyme